MEVQTATKSERLTVLLSREEKQDIEARARAADLSVGEFMRRAGRDYDPEPELDRVTLEAIAKIWHENVTHMRDTLRATLEKIDRNNAEMRALRERRDGAR